MGSDKRQEGISLTDLSSALPSNIPDVKKRVEVLRKIQSQHDEFEAKFFKERAAFEAKYWKLYQPLYSKRHEIVNGVVEVESVKIEITEETVAADNVNEVKGVPDFWLIALTSHELIANEIQKCDVAALKYLKDIKWCRTENPKGFKLEFYFDTNPFFKNSVLTKAYHMIDDDNEPILEKAIGTEIEWYPEKCLTQRILRKKPKKGSKDAEPVTKTEYRHSFFNFFNPPKVPEDETDIGCDAADEIQSKMEQDYDIGTIIRDKIIPHAVSWYTGEAEGVEINITIFDDDDDDDLEEDEDEETEEQRKARKKETFSCHFLKKLLSIMLELPMFIRINKLI